MGRMFKSAGVVGLGTMGAGIAEILARSGIEVIGIEVDDTSVERGRGHLERSTQRAVARNRLAPQDRQALLDRVRYSTRLDDLSEVDLVIEAVPERLEAKRELLRRLDEICRGDAVFATNTSSLSVTDIAVSTSYPHRVIGMHFFNPAPVLRLVEVVRTVLSAPAVVAAVAQLAERLGKTPVVVGDRAGFVANALLFGYLGEAIRLAESGAAAPADIDTAMKVGCGLPLGPLALLDLIGLDTSFHVLESLHRETGEPRHAPPAMLRRLVSAGLLGRKSGQGFFSYDDKIGGATDSSSEPGNDVSGDLTGRAIGAVGVHEVARAPGGHLVEVLRGRLGDPADADAARAAHANAGVAAVVCDDRPGGIVDRLLFPYLNDAVRMVESRYCTVTDVDTAMTAGCGYPIGPFGQLDAIGASVAVEVLDDLRAAYGDPSYVPVPLLRGLAAAGRTFAELHG